MNWKRTFWIYQSHCPECGDRRPRATHVSRLWLYVYYVPTHWQRADRTG